MTGKTCEGVSGYQCRPLPHVSKISRKAQKWLDRSELLISPIVLLEIQLLAEIGRVKMSSEDVLRKITFELGVKVCDLPFIHVIEAAQTEHRTRDPFDRKVVTHAKANGLAHLVSSDPRIQEVYSRTIW